MKIIYESWFFVCNNSNLILNLETDYSTLEINALSHINNVYFSDEYINYNLYYKGTK